MEVILSIKPQFANLIFQGKKKYEFRRKIFKQRDISKVIVYASSPISKIIGEFEIGGILEDEIDILWANTKKGSGITSDYYHKYFLGKEEGFAIKINKPKKYKKGICIKEKFGMLPPQSFAYIKNEIG